MSRHAPTRPVQPPPEREPDKGTDSGKFQTEPPPGMLDNGTLNVVGFEPVEGDGPRVHIHRD